MLWWGRLQPFNPSAARTSSAEPLRRSEHCVTVLIVNPRRLLLPAALGALFLAAMPSHAQAPRERQLFDNGWRFHLGDVNQGQSTALADKDWRLLDLPH